MGEGANFESRTECHHALPIDHVLSQIKMPLFIGESLYYVKNHWQEISLCRQYKLMALFFQDETNLQLSKTSTRHNFDQLQYKNKQLNVCHV